MTSRYLKLAGMAAAVVVASMGAQSAFAAPGSIVGSVHDLAPAGGQVCIYCHAPHNTNATVGVLWNHALTTATFTLYASPTMNAVPSQPAGTSKLCLSCHDGTVAIDSFGGATGTSFTTGSKNLGTDLSNDHPIGFTYDAALVTADPGLKAITTTANIGVGGVSTGTIASNLLKGGKVECASCHDVHNSASGTAVQSKLLRITNAGSALCLTCHAK